MSDPDVLTMDDVAYRAYMKERFGDFTLDRRRVNGGPSIALLGWSCEEAARLSASRNARNFDADVSVECIDGRWTTVIDHSRSIKAQREAARV